MDLAERIKQKFAVALRPHPVPEWAEVVYLKGFRQREIEALQKRHGGTLTDSELLAVAVLDEGGKPLLSAEQWRDCPVGAVRDLVAAVQRHNRFADAPAEAAQKNS